MTHWHLLAPVRWSMHDTARFDTERMRVERLRPTAGVARTPADVVQWLDDTLDALIVNHGLNDAMLRSSGIATPTDRASLSDTRLFMAERGLDVLSMLALRGGEVAHYGAHAMTERECSAPH